jgi:hypothetical protein
VATAPRMPVLLLPLGHGVNLLCRFTGWSLGDGLECELNQSPEGKKLVLVGARCRTVAAEHTQRGGNRLAQLHSRHGFAWSLFSMQSMSSPAISSP